MGLTFGHVLLQQMGHRGGALLQQVLQEVSWVLSISLGDVDHRGGHRALWGKAQAEATFVFQIET